MTEATRCLVLLRHLHARGEDGRPVRRTLAELRQLRHQDQDLYPDQDDDGQPIRSGAQRLSRDLRKIGAAGWPLVRVHTRQSEGKGRAPADEVMVYLADGALII